MSFIKTLAKLAVGVAAVKGVGNLVQKRAGGTGQGAGQGGFGGMIDDLLASGRGAGGGRGQGGGSLDSLLGSLTGGFSRDTNRNRATAPSGGIGDMLRQALGNGGGAQGGGIGGLLASVLGGRGGAGGSSAAGAGGLGGILGALGGALGGGALGAGLGGAAQAGTPPQEASAAGAMGTAPAQAAEMEAELEAALMIRAMIMAAKADGELDASERARLSDAVADAPEAEVAFIESEIAAHRSLNDLLSDVPRGLEEKVYIASVMAISVDTDAERSYLRDLADGLGLSAPEVAQIHQHLGLPGL